ncbi:hypothetical protein GCM10011358_00060 [Sinisalibacter lacisalsi]|uniref:DNA-binding protein n=2 Tax=Sinisalibacter lacisalsi TaxID=1526570 RepID=A0ABQ1Q9X2_9RHOB|nr:hypothetical protein GCM10011358_00060 [Sinisalibacter lacisalsi]
MNTLPAAKLFKEPANWPLMPPWWLLSSTDAAALLNIKPATLHSWRIRGHGPRAYPPMYLRPTQGRPLYYQYGTLRGWAAAALGMGYEIEDQCIDFFHSVFPVLAEGSGTIAGRIRVFEDQFQQDREKVLRGQTGNMIDRGHVHQLDIYRERQPTRIGKAPLIGSI